MRMRRPQRLRLELRAKRRLSAFAAPERGRADDLLGCGAQRLEIAGHGRGLHRDRAVRREQRVVGLGRSSAQVLRRDGASARREHTENVGTRLGQRL